MSKKIKFSLIASTVLVLSSFIPVLQVLILTLNGAFVSLFTNDGSKIILIVNSISSVIMFVLFYLSSSITAKLLSLLGVLLFFIPFLFYITENQISTEKYYFIQFLIIGIITGLILIGLEYLRSKKATQ
jgi:hypothetical protein